MKKQHIDIKQSALAAVQVVAHYRVIAIIVVIGGVYGFVLFTISSLGNVQPSETSVTNEVTAISVPKIDKAVVKQLQDLRDNSVSVQTLFNQARDNPFTE